MASEIFKKSRKQNGERKPETELLICMVGKLYVKKDTTLSKKKDRV